MSRLVKVTSFQLANVVASYVQVLQNIYVLCVTKLVLLGVAVLDMSCYLTGRKVVCLAS